MGSKLKFKKIFELAQLLSGEVGATRPIVYAGWVDEEALVGQAGKNIKPQVLFSFGISGAIQHTAALTDADFIIAVNKNPNATMMKMADVAMKAAAPIGARWMHLASVTDPCSEALLAQRYRRQRFAGRPAVGNAS